MKRLITPSAIAMMVLSVALFGMTTTTQTARAVACTPTGFFRDGINMTAALINPGTVSGDVNATGCDIGVYFAPGSTGSVADANIFGANYFGVAVQQAAVNVSGSSVHDIGETPMNGTQHGVAIYYATVDNGSSSAQPACTSGTTKGTISGNIIGHYQKGGIVVNCTGSTVAVSGNSVNGEGPVDYIAQNGIQFSRGADGVVRDNSISGNFYSGTVGVGPNSGGQNPPGWEYTSGGLLLYQAGDVMVAQNYFSGNQRNVEMVP